MGETEDHEHATVPRSLRAHWVVWIGCVTTLVAAPVLAADALDFHDAVVVRLVHPERQAAAILALFEGARALHPAAALVAWKRATKTPGQLGKPLEALIALFNPAMVPEWAALDGAEVHFALDGSGSGLRWYAVVPRDDGTVAAVITALRLTDGADEPPLEVRGVSIPVERLGRAPAPLGVRVGRQVVIASDRGGLAHALGLDPAGRRLGPSDPGAAPAAGPALGSIPRADPPSGLVFEIDADRLADSRFGSIDLRRGVELVRGLGYRRIAGTLAIERDRIGLELVTKGAPARSVGGAVATTALGRIPTAGMMAMVSLAIDPTADFWTSAFAVADRVERVDPARAGLASLRTRLNLLAASAGARLESELWPRLRGVTIGVYGDSTPPGRPSGAVLVLHLDSEPAAVRVTSDLVPKMAGLLPDARRGPVALGEDRERPRRLGTLDGKDLAVDRWGSDVALVWGARTLIDSVMSGQAPAARVATLPELGVAAGLATPGRMGAIWPGRWLPFLFGLESELPAVRALADDPPLIWRGRNDTARALDTLEYSGLTRRVRQFLDTIPQDPPRLP